MAEKVRLIRLTWENDASFEMETKLDDGNWLTVVMLDENNYFDKIWETGIKPAAKQFFNDEIDKIGAEMKA